MATRACSPIAGIPTHGRSRDRRLRSSRLSEHTKRFAARSGKLISRRRHPAADFRMGLKLGLKKPLVLPSDEERIDPAEAQRLIRKLKAVYHPRRPLRNKTLV